MVVLKSIKKMWNIKIQNYGIETGPRNVFPSPKPPDQLCGPAICQ